MKTVRNGIGSVAAIALLLSACATNETAAGGSADSGTQSTLAGTLQGVGASSTKSAQEVWRAAFQTAHPKVTINYSPDGSGAGRTAFRDGGAAFAGSDRALSDDQMSGRFASCAADTPPLNLPIYVAPIAIVFNLEGVSELYLSAALIAMIFRGEINNWNDPAIAELNSDLPLPDLAITPVHRSDNSGTTENFTATLAEVVPEIWTDAASGDWPSSIRGEAAQGTSGVVAAVQNGVGTIGYADESGIPETMTVAKYSKTGIGGYVGPEAAAAAALVEAASRANQHDPNDWALKLNRNAVGYPFVLVSYAIVCQEYQDPATGELVNAYMSYVVSDAGQQAAVPHAGNAPLPGSLATGVQAAAASIR